MSGPRASSRVLELAARACEAALRRELAEIAKEDEILAKVQECLEQGVCVQEDFALPFEWIREKRVRRARSYNDSESDSDEDNVAPEVQIPRYRKLRQNLYKAPLQRPAIPLEECTHSCNCKFGSGCGSQCHNRLVYMECVPDQCPSLVQPGVCQPTKNKNRSGVKMETEDDADSAESEDNIGYCENTAIQTRTYPAVEVFLTSEPPSTELLTSTESDDNQTQNEPSSKKKKGSTVESANASAPVSRGYGLRLLEPVRKGTLLIEYLGEVITAAEGARRMSEYVLGDDFYFMGLDNGLMLDAKTMGSAARFANHSCAPSCLLQKWTVRGECRLVLVAKRDLPAGAEITYNYHYFDDSFEGVRGMRRQKCMCGAKHCCGTIGGRVTKGTRINTDTTKTNGGRNRGRPSSTASVITSAINNTASVHEDSDSEDEFVSINDMYRRCVSLQLLPEINQGELSPTEKLSSDGSGSSGGSSSVDLTTLANNTSSYVSLDNAAIANPLSNCTKKYALDFLQSLTGEIRTCIEKNTALGLANVPSTRFISNNDHFVHKLQLLVSELENSVEQANAWVKQYDRIFHQPNTNSSSVTKLVDLTVAQELVFIAPKNVKIEQVSLLEGQIRTLLKVKRTLDSCVNVTPVVCSSGTTDLLVPIKAEPFSSTSSSIARTAQAATTGANNSIKQAAISLHWDDLLNTTRLLLSALPLTLDDTYILELLKRYETYSLWVRQTLSPVVAGCSGTKSRRSAAAMTSQTSANNKKSASVNNHSSGLDSTSAEFEEYALLLRFLDMYCLQECIRVDHLPFVATASTELSTAATTCSESDTFVNAAPTVEVVEILPLTVSHAQTEHENADGEILLNTVEDTEPPTSLNDTTVPATGKKQKGRSKQAATTVPPPLLVLSQPLLTDIFSAAQFYNSRLSVYMEKLQIESALLSGATEPLVHKNFSQMLTEVPIVGEGSNDALYFENNVDLFAQWEVRQTGLCTVQESYEKLQHANKFTTSNLTAPTNAPSNTDTNDVLYCFCRLPEADGESSILTECSICCNWYHPQCVNSGYTTLSAAARQKSFLCPVCTHLDGQVSSLSYLPNEWNIIKPVAAKVPELKKDTTKTTSKSSHNGKKTRGRPAMSGRISNNSSSISSAVSVEDDMSSGKRKRFDNTSTSSASGSAALVSRHPLVKFKTAPAIKNKEYITVEELQQILEKENEHTISGSPVTLLLGLARKYCLSWQDECRSFLSSDPVRLLLSRIDAYAVSANTVTTTHRSVNSAGPGTTTSTTAVEIILYNTLQQEAVILQRGMQLYLQLRLVRIRGEECTILRQLAWVITTSTLYRRTTTGSSHNNMLSITELSSMVAGGSALFSSASSALTVDASANTTAYTQCVQTIQTTGTALLQLLLARQTLATVLLNQANKCKCRDEARTLLPQFRELRDRAMVKTEDIFAFARIKCLSRTANIGPEAAVTVEVYNNTVGSPIAAVEPRFHQVEAVGNTVQASVISEGKVTASGIPSSPAPVVYCWCRKEDSGTPMVCCDGCEEWFHCHCVGLNGLNAPNSRKKKELDTYLCISCSILSGKAYGYGW